MKPLVADLNKNGFIVDKYTSYPKPSNGITNLILTIENPFTDKDYEKLMKVFKNWIDTYEVNLHFKNKDTNKITDSFYYENFKKEVAIF